MLESGTLEGWVVPRVQEKPRLNKPPLIYWLQASSAGLLGDKPGQWSWLDRGSENIWVYRVPSVLSAMAAVLLTWRLGVRMFDPRAGWLAAAMLAVCPMVVWDAHQARADQLLLAMTTATMFALWCVWSKKKSHHGGAETRSGNHARKKKVLGWVLAFWLFLALGVMTKGPITPLIAGLTCLALSLVSRNWSWLLNLRPALGILIVAAVVAPWVYLVGHEVGWSKYFSIIYDETIGRSAGAKEGHWGPPGYHIVLLGALFWPGSLLTAAAIARACRRGMHDSARTDNARPGFIRRTLAARPSRPAELFLLAWMLPAWIVFELISTKLPHYTMPLYPAVALMSARGLFAVASRAKFYKSSPFPPGHVGVVLWAVIGVAILAILPLIIIVIGNLPTFTGWIPMFLAISLFAALAISIVVAAAVLWRRRQLLALQLAGIAAIPLFAIMFFHFVMPNSEYLWASRSLTRAAHAADPRRPLASVGFNEDSLVFLRRGDVHRIPIDALPAWISSHPNGIVAINQLEYQHGLPLREIHHFGGFNYSNGEPAHMTIYEVIH